MWGSAADNIWAVGSGGTIQRWTGESFSTPLPKVTTQNLTRIVGSGPNDVWATGAGGAVVHYDGASWKLQATDPYFPWNDMMITGPGDVQVVADGGAIMRHR